MLIKFVKPSYEITMPMSGIDMLKHIEKCTRVCYASEDKITEDSYLKFCKMLLDRRHMVPFEHCYVTINFKTDRGVSHELVRHRIASFCQSSTRYVNYRNKGIEFIIPSWCDILEAQYDIDFVYEDVAKFEAEKFWISHMFETAYNYKRLLDLGWMPQQARSVLPNSLATEINMTCNLRELRTIFELRCSKAAHPDMRAIMIPLLEKIKTLIPIVFDDLVFET